VTASAPLSFDALDLSPTEVAQRFRWARRQGHPSYVWPDVPMAGWSAAARAIESVTAAALASGVAVSPPLRLGLSAPGDAVEPARALGVAAFTSGMGPWLGRWIEDGTLLADPDTAAVLELHLRHARVRAGRVLELLGSLGPTLRGLDPCPLILKGVHTGWMYFPEPSCRPAADVDLLVAPELRRATEQALESRGYTLTQRQRRPIRSVWRPPGAPNALPSLSLSHGQGPLTVDLHASLERSFLGIRAVALAWPRAPDTVAIPGLPDPFRGLAAPHLVLSLALHASEDLHNMQLLRVVEIVLVARSMGDGDWDRVIHLADGSDALRFAWPALALADQLAPGAVRSDVLRAATARVPERIRRVVTGLTPGTALRLDGLSIEERLMGASTRGELLRRIGHMLLPSRAGNSPRELGRIYLERVYRLFRGRVRLRSGRADGGRSES